MKNISLELLDGGVGIATLDMPDRPFNVFSEQMMDELEATLERACAECSGLVIRSGKKSFVAGADLVMIKDFANMRFRADRQQMRDRFSRLGKLFRRIERSPIPIVAAINGLALGGGLELAMACHGRVCSDSETRLLGLPEVGLGLLPGAGGTQRLPRLIGIEAAIRMLLSGAPVTPGYALEHGLVDALASEADLLGAAVARLEGLEPRAAWDRQGWQLPAIDQELLARADWQQFCLERGRWLDKQHRWYPAVASIIDCVGRGAALSIDEGMDVEWDIFVELMSDPVAANMVVTCFLNKGLAESGGELLSALDRAVQHYLSTCGRPRDVVAREAAAVDAGALLGRAGVDAAPAGGDYSTAERTGGLAMLADVALQMYRKVAANHDQLDAVAVLQGGWPQWTGGPVALLAMLQRGELGEYELPPAHAIALSRIDQPLKDQASYSRSARAA